MSKSLYYTDCKYIEQEKFIDFCKESSVAISLNNLEYCERIKLLYPIKRLLFSEEYAIWREQIFSKSSDTQDYNLSYTSLIKLEHELSNFNDLKYHDKIKHPFDELGEKWQEYLKEPKNNEFIDWKEYNVKFVHQSGSIWDTNRAKNYYSYWQIYELAEINDFRTKYCKIDFITKENKYHLSLDSEVIKKQSICSKEKILKISAFENCYNCLCDFIQSFERVRSIAFKNKEIRLTLTESEYDILKIKIKQLSTEIRTHYNLTVDRLYEFLDMLCVQYFIYMDAEKYKLQNLIQRDIFYTLKLIHCITANPWEEILSKIDKTTLDLIFPNERDEIKEIAMSHIEIQLKRYNIEIPKYELTMADMSKFIAFVEKNGLDYFLIFVTEGNKDYFSMEYRAQKILPFHLRNLSIFVEEFAKSIHANSIDEIRTQKFDGVNFADILRPICKKELWWSKYSEMIKRRFVPVNPDNFGDELKRIQKEIDSIPKTKAKKIDQNHIKIVLTHLSKATLIRNYYAHNSVQIDTFIEDYPSLLENLICSIFIIWAIGKNTLKNL